MYLYFLNFIISFGFNVVILIKVCCIIFVCQLESL